MPPLGIQRAVIEEEGKPKGGGAHHMNLTCPLATVWKKAGKKRRLQRLVEARGGVCSSSWQCMVTGDLISAPPIINRKEKLFL